MSSIRAVPILAESSLGQLKSIIEKIFNPSAERARLAKLERERVKDLVRSFPQSEHLLRQNIRSHLNRLFKEDEVIYYMGRQIEVGKAEDLEWIEIEGMIEHQINRMMGYKPELIAEKLGYSTEMFLEIMKKIGEGGSYEMNQSPRVHQTATTA